MRPGNNNRRGRNRGQRKQHGGIPNKNQNYDGGGGETRVRGNVYQVLEKYLQLARDAGVAGDRIAAENYLQHADHYYRVIQAMNDGQRPRIGGRDISVADFNVQNVSQGLSAALYTGGQAPQPNMEGGNPNPNPQQGNIGNGNAGAGEEGNGEDAQAGGETAGEFGHQQGNQPQGGRNQRQRYQNRQDGNRENRGESRGENRGQYANGQYAQNAAEPERQNSAEPSQRPEVAVDPPVVAHHPAAVAKSTPVNDEQPDYPEDLLPPVTPDSAPQDGRSNRAPRAGRLRTRRPRAAAGEAAAEPALPGVEGGE